MRNKKDGGIQNDSWAFGLMNGRIAMLSIEIGNIRGVRLQGEYKMSLVLDVLSFSSLKDIQEEMSVR